MPGPGQLTPAGAHAGPPGLTCDDRSGLPPRAIRPDHPIGVAWKATPHSEDLCHNGGYVRACTMDSSHTK